MSRDYRDNEPRAELSDEFLNAFVDDQLDAEEKSRAYVIIGNDEFLNRRVCELRKLRDLVALAYQNPPVPPRQIGAARNDRRIGLGIAAGVVLAFGIMLGWLLHQPGGWHHAAAPTTTPSAQLATVGDRTASAAHNAAGGEQPTARVVQAATGIADPMRVLIHINDDSEIRLKQALDEIESLLAFYRASDQPASVEVVINGEGLALVRADVSAFGDRVRDLQRQYTNLTFAACQNTIDRLQREKGVTARLLPGVIVIDSGVARIMRRQQQGWAYIQV